MFLQSGKSRVPLLADSPMLVQVNGAGEEYPVFYFDIVGVVWDRLIKYRVIDKFISFNINSKIWRNGNTDYQHRIRKSSTSLSCVLGGRKHPGKFTVP